MKSLRSTRLCALALLAGSLSGASLAGERVQVYDSTQIALDSYTVIKRMGVSDWKSAFRIAGYSDETQAREALLAQAAQVGADAVVNLHCLSQTDRVWNPAGYYCYGNAIKLKSR